MPSRTMNTMSEGLTSLAQMITDLKFAPDADVQWLVELETAVIQKARDMQPQPSPLPAAPGAGGAAGAPGGGGADLMAMLGGPMSPSAGAMPPPLPGPPGGMPMGGPTPMSMGGGGAGMPQGASGLMSRPIPNGDEIGRLMASGSPRGGRYGP